MSYAMARKVMITMARSRTGSRSETGIMVSRSDVGNITVTVQVIQEQLEVTDNDEHSCPPFTDSATGLRYLDVPFVRCPDAPLWVNANGSIP